MEQKRENVQSPFALAAESFAAALPKRVFRINDEFRPVELPKWRYGEITMAVLNMFEKVDARVMPIPVFDIANGLGYSVVPYRAYGQRIHDVLLAASKDALTMQFWGSDNPVILYNDRMIPTRINFSIMHEIAHNELGHKEPSELAEKEAHYFAGVALCPMALLIHYGIMDARRIAEVFNVSDEFAKNRLRAAKNRIGSGRLNLNNGIDRAFIERFSFKASIQLDLFQDMNYGAVAQ